MVASPTTAETRSAALGLLIYDGDCGFCTQTARKFGVFAGESAEIAAWQSLDLDEFDNVTEADVNTAAYWIQDGVAYRGADAFVQALQVCGTPLRIAGKVLGLPPFIWLARATYPLLAKYRHRLPGATDMCRLDQQP